MIFGEIIKETEFPFVNLTYYKNRLKTEFLDAQNITSENLKDFITEVTNFYKGNPFVKLADIRTAFFTPSPEQKEIMAKNPAEKLIIAEAILVGNISETLQAKNFKYYNKPIYPIEIFKDESNALDWLNNCYTKSISKGNSKSCG